MKLKAYSTAFSGAFCLFLGLLFALPAVAETSPPTSLTQTELNAINKEVLRRERREDLGPNWESLNKEKLQVLLKMKDFANFSRSTRALLIDQAGAWDLLDFEKPSDAQAMWARWYPEEGIDRHVGNERESLHSPILFFYADEKWASKSAAMIGFMHCISSPVWYVWDEEPMIWAMRQNSGWEQANVFDFGKCIRQQSNEGRPSFPNAPTTSRGMITAEILERKISDYLLKYGCTRKGPDSCLPLLHALQSLNPKHEKLVEIIKRLEPSFEVQQNNNLPIRNQDFSAITQLKFTPAKQAIFLTAKLPVVLRQPSAWPKDELEKTLRSLTQISLELDRLKTLQGGRSDNIELGNYEFIKPWANVTEKEKNSSIVKSTITKLDKEQILPANILPRRKSQ